MVRVRGQGRRVVGDIRRLSTLPCSPAEEDLDPPLGPADPGEAWRTLAPRIVDVRRFCVAAQHLGIRVRSGVEYQLLTHALRYIDPASLPVRAAGKECARGAGRERSLVPRSGTAVARSDQGGGGCRGVLQPRDWPYIPHAPLCGGRDTRRGRTRRASCAVMGPQFSGHVCTPLPQRTALWLQREAMQADPTSVLGARALARYIAFAENPHGKIGFYDMKVPSRTAWRPYSSHRLRFLTHGVVASRWGFPRRADACTACLPLGTSSRAVSSGCCAAARMGTQARGRTRR